MNIERRQPTEIVAEYHKTFDYPIREVPQIPVGRVQLRVNIIEEELNKLKLAIAKNDLVAIAEGFCKLQFGLSGGILEFGLGNKFPELFSEVARSKMSKACENPKEAKQTVAYYQKQGTESNIIERNSKFFIHRKSDNKLLKSIGFSQPELASILKKERVEVEKKIIMANCSTVKLLSTLALLIFFILNFTTGFAQAKKKPASPHKIFKFKYYELLKDKNEDFDSVTLWNNAKLKKTFSNSGAVMINHARAFVRVTLSNDTFKEQSNIFHSYQGYELMINGNRLYQFTDPDKGRAIAIYQFDTKQWIIYYGSKPKPALVASQK